MPTEVPCTACGWTTRCQESCNYNSHVKLFYGVSDRGVWSIGTKWIVKERSNNSPPNFEAQNIRFLQSNTTIPVPTILDESSETDESHIILMKRIHGATLKAVWVNMSTAERDHVASQTAECLAQLRQLHADRVGGLDNQPIYSAFLFRNGYGLPHGPISSDDQLWYEMSKGLHGLLDETVRRLRARMPPATPYTFTHGDLSLENIIVKEGKLAGIVDWESSGYFPVWWEFVSTGISLGPDDLEWKSLLQKHMEKHTEAYEFWRDYYSLSKYPDLDDRGTNLLRELESGDNS
ncbi:hypothetical protein JX266_014232 [Neoarthrinium moseri]|uniref:uncharacterized protein n=1 Tax=Neoarthrinium moseri TaxID=1658444 RepID=UPI001FDC8A0C|nr:uncharacterized protein JN550_013726 [Neoarthrinium moseri]KAI1839556.1 hypothetical protein JX266_014232 [Neoarthrinium moseri]KAI1856662.1 hypothetical protein JN550_013726 [Neoarthrinium moseri]